MKNITNSFCLLLLFVQGIIYGQFSNVAPTLTATGDQIYCSGSMKIVTDITIVDPDDTGIDAIYIQISSGYINGEDSLLLTGSHPTIQSNWDSMAGKLKLSGIVQPTYTNLISAIKDVEFSTSSLNPSGIRKFSITVGQANYLTSNGHYYQYIPNIGVSWTIAKILAQSSTYYGLQGYLATITSTDEAQLAGEQASGAGWIGGSDEQTEGIWKWVTGPENGTVFWNGNSSGSTTNFAKWNNGEPNNMGNENYVHITSPGVGNIGSWNDLSNTGAVSGNYQPKGFIVEYGGMPGDPTLHISTSSSISFPEITSSSTDTRCGTGSVTLQATSNTGIVNWYDTPFGGTIIGTGNNFSTPSISTDTVFYMAPHINNCSDNIRIPITAHVIQIPIITVNSTYNMCNENPIKINATISLGTLNWYDSPISSNPIFSGTQFSVPNIHQDTTYYLEAVNSNCLSNRIPILVKVYALPNVYNENFEICQDATILLDAGISDLSYLWSTGETTQTIYSNGLKNYSVMVTTLENCSKNKTFTINYHSTPKIANVLISDATATIEVVQSGDFDYSIDGINYQNSNFFSLLEGGIHTAFVRERNGCGEDKKTFASITFPEYFSPNGDNINDLWTIREIQNFPNAEIKIFNRFGSLITIINSSNPSWNGTLNGALLPSADYWFVSKIDNTYPEIRGHFSLKR